MQERQVTIGDQTNKLPEPFLVMAPQNPIEQEGTYPLPEAQVDRFMLKVIVQYPKREEERQIIRLNLAEQFPKPQAAVSAEQILEARKLVKQIHISDKIEDYILDIVFATRYPEQYNLHKLIPLIRYGASPRASIFLALAAKAKAFMEHRAFVLPDDIKSVAFEVLRHRIGLTYEAEAENITTEDIITDILNQIEVP
jgi:MoxR-like ATPase